MHFTVEHGSFRYHPSGRQVLEDISFDFDCRGVLAILGRNGAGKTTLLRSMLGLQRWAGGRTLIDGEDISRIPVRRLWSRIGYVPQARSTNFALTCEETVLLGRSARMGLFSHPGRADRTAARDAMAAVGVGHLAGKLTNEISGGELQLVLIARALAVEPELIILDEPESNLDFRNQLRVLQVLKSLTETRGLGAIINTHFPAHALEIARMALVLMPDGTTRYGPALSVLTEAVLSASFGVGVRILPVDIPERPGYACVAAYAREGS